MEIITKHIVPTPQVASFGIEYVATGQRRGLREGKLMSCQPAFKQVSIGLIKPAVSDGL
jgi:hypothetical protein